MDNIVESIIFDYGGTLDNRGDHWARTIADAYDTLPCAAPDLDTFKSIYVFAERELARNPIVKPDFTFADTMLAKARLELEEWRRLGMSLSDNEIETYSRQIAEFCDARARQCTSEACEILDYLSAKYPLALVSNFYGNVGAVLADYGLDKYFPIIIESAVVGVRKPDPAIFALGIDALKTPAEKTLVVGDSISKDINPAQSLGCPTVWIKGRPWFADELPNSYGTTMENVLELRKLY